MSDFVLEGGEMIRVLGLWGWVLGAVAMAAPAREATEPLELFVAPAWVRLSSDAIPEEADTEAKLVATRGERESFFVVIRGVSPVAPVAARVLGLRAGRASLDPSLVTVHRVAYVRQGPSLIADALLPLEATPQAPLLSGNQLTLFVEARIPREARAGLYRGAIQLSVGEQQAELPLSVQVLPVTLPSMASLPAALDFEEREAAFGSPAGVDTAALSHGLARAALSHRLTLLGLGGTPPYRTLPGEGAMELDFVRYDAAVAPFVDGSSNPEGARFSALLVPAPAGMNAVSRFKYALGFTAHLRKKGWRARRVDFEPATRSELFDAENIELADWSRCASGRSPRRWWLLQGDEKQEPISLGLGAAPESIRAIGWLAYSAGASGIRYPAAFRGFRTGVVDPAALFYPPASQGERAPLLIPSVRLALLRDGLEDYELLRLAESRGAGETARSWAKRLAPSVDTFTRSPASYAAAKRALAASWVPSAQ